MKYIPTCIWGVLALAVSVSGAVDVRPRMLDERIRRQLTDAINGTAPSNSSSNGVTNDRTALSLVLASDKQCVSNHILLEFV